MMIGLPKSLEVCKTSYAIYTDFRDIIEICIALNDRDITDEEKAIILINNLYECEMDELPDLDEALKKAMWFIDCGQTYEGSDDTPSLINWEKDFNYVCAAVNLKVPNVLDIRDVEYMHWWTFLGYFAERGKCYLSTLIDIREKLAKGKPLEKWEQEFYQENRQDVDINYYDEEDDFWN